MCGICGVVEPAARSVDPGPLSRMMDAMAHRGPDDAGVFTHGPVGLGFRRLSIIDLAGGNQPMRGEDGQVVSVVNGEIYNYRELREELGARGHRLVSSNDAEVVPHLYEEWGIDGISRLRGMFALAIRDERADRLYLARDHFGIKPLYYARDGGTLLFASEIRSLLASGRLRPSLDTQAVWHYFTFQYVPDPLTMWSGVYRLPPAHYLLFQNGALSLHRYWQLAFEPEPARAAPSLAQTAERIQDTLRDSVRRHMVSDVPRGAYLSSGIDSSFVVALMREREDVDTFSIGFSGNHREVNELGAARRIAEALGTRHHEVEVSPGEYRDLFARIVASQEEPIADPSAPALYFLAREARRHVTVILSGEGSDELFGGYPIYREPGALRPFEWMPPGLRGMVGRMARALPPGMKGRGYLERGARPLERRFIGNARMFTDDEKRDFLRVPDARGLQDPYSVTDPYYAASARLDPVARMQTVDCHTWLPGDILMKADKMSMAHSLELRVPFLDVAVFEVASRLPVEFRVGRGTTKVALREAARGILPDEVVSRPKLGFPIPIREWIAADLHDFIHDVFQTVQPAVMDTTYFEGLLNDAGTFVWNRNRKIWTAFTFLVWYQAYMEPQSPWREGLGEPASTASETVSAMGVTTRAR
jgi:asparagine synthase (glutamine-hydrolysing)